MLLQVTKALDGVLLDNTISMPFGCSPLGDDYFDFGDAPPATEVEEPKLSDDDLLVANPCLYGYNFTTKRWGKSNPTHPYSVSLNFVLTMNYLRSVAVGVDSVGPIEWNDEPFDNLVLSGNQKTLVKALVEAHYATDAASGRASYARFDDFVQGKGQGLVINLFGNPGVGKTLTAEATSERKRFILFFHYHYQQRR